MSVWLVNKEYADYGKYFLEEQLKMPVEYFDFYLLHAMNNKDRVKEAENLGDFSLYRA